MILFWGGASKNLNYWLSDWGKQQQQQQKTRPNCHLLPVNYYFLQLCYCHCQLAYVLTDFLHLKYLLLLILLDSLHPWTGVLHDFLKILKIIFNL